MSVEHGIVIGGVIQPGTGWIRRDSRAFWRPQDSHDVRSRRGYRVTVALGHWTGGHHHEGEETGHRVYRAIEARERGDGSDMAVSCGFVIGWDGLTWQTCDLLDATIHIGDRAGYLRSVGIETAWCGTVEQARKLGIRGFNKVTGQARGREIECVAPSAALVGAWRALIGALCDIRHPAVEIPKRVVPYIGKPQRTPQAGICEHRDVPSTQGKIDAAGLLVGALDR